MALGQEFHGIMFRAFIRLFAAGLVIVNATVSVGQAQSPPQSSEEDPAAREKRITQERQAARDEYHRTHPSLKLADVNAFAFGTTWFCKLDGDHWKQGGVLLGQKSIPQTPDGDFVDQELSQDWVEKYRDEWTICLHNPKNRMSLQANLHRRMCRIGSYGQWVDGDHLPAVIMDDPPGPQPSREDLRQLIASGQRPYEITEISLDVHRNLYSVSWQPTDTMETFIERCEIRRNTEQTIVGKYQRVPVENDWHRGEIVWLGDHQFAWKNEAGSEWRLTPDLNNSRLLKSVGSDYYDLPKGKEFTLKLKIGRQIPADYTEIADWDTIELGSVLGFSHAGEYFERTGDL